MFNRVFGSVMIVTSAFTLIIGQTPEPKKTAMPEPPKTFSFSFDGGSYLGVQTAEVTRENFSKFGLRDVRGVAVEKVAENSPAAAAGIKEGDVIVRFNGDEVTSTRKLTRLVSEVDPDHQVRLTVVRGGGEQELTATVVKRPTPAAFADGSFFPAPPGVLERFERMPALPEFRDLPNLKGFDFKELPNLKGFDFKELPNLEGFKSFTLPNADGKGFTWSSSGSRQIGIGVTSLTDQLAKHYGVTGGLLISEVRENSPAAKAGLRAGDIIVEANGKAVKGDFDLIREVNRKKEGDVTLVLVRNGNRQTISVTPEVSKDQTFFFNSDGADGDGGRLLTPPAPRTPPTPGTPASPAIFRWNHVI
jgi:serine protease Do